MNLLLAGMSPRMMPELIDEIVDFTELGAFIHVPVRTYSSGMSARLSFGIYTRSRLTF
jgi:ABC-type polysaccharide/polyol phosphate transport system ATPase subunit